MMSAARTLEPALGAARQLTCSDAKQLMMLPAKIRKPSWVGSIEGCSPERRADGLPRYVPDYVCREHLEYLENYDGSDSESSGAAAAPPPPVEASPRVEDHGPAPLQEDLPLASLDTGSAGASDCPCGSESEDSSAKAYTTVMVLNIPNHISMKSFMEKLDATGWKGAYNFCNIPRALSNGKNLGFAFVNFDTPAHAEAFSQEWAGQESFGKGKRLKTRPAKIQGIEANVLLAQKSMKRRNTSFKPLMSF